MSYFQAFIAAFSLVFLLTPFVKTLAIKIGAIDRPDNLRKIHTRPVARLGGVAIVATFVVLVLINFTISRQLLGLLGGILILLVIGIIDDLRGLNPWVKLAGQVIAACVALAGGIGISAIASPFGGYLPITAGRFLVQWGSLSFHITPIANLLSIIWMVGLINAINFLDGLDGLADGVSGIAAVVIFMLSLKFHQPAVAMLSIILAGAAFGFLPFNFFPAKIFLGDSGSYFLGLTLAMLAIYSGGKLATASLVLGFTIVDGVWTVLRRMLRGVSPFKADSNHLHHLFLSAGLTQRQAVLTLYGVSIVFGAVALISQSLAKFVAFVVLALATMALIATLTRLSAKNLRIKNQ